MEFTADRLVLLEMAQKTMRLASESSPLEMLKGIYLESDEDTGEVSMIATNYEAAIFLKENATVLRSGKLVINAKLLTRILTMFSGDQVNFSSDCNAVRISSGSCVYNLVYMPAENYPKPVMPFPDDTFKLSGICGLARKTVFAVAKSNDKPSLECIYLKVRQNSALAAACDGIRMILVKGQAESSGVHEFLIPAQSFQILASISTDQDVFSVGLAGREAVFTKKGMLFSIKLQSGDFIDTNAVVQSLRPKYTAVTDIALIRQALDIVSAGTETAPVKLVFANDAICLNRVGEMSLSSSEVSARLTGIMPESGFFYKLDYLVKLFQVISGTVKIEIDDKGMMLVRTKNEVYFQLPVKAPANKVNESVKQDSAA